LTPVPAPARGSAFAAAGWPGGFAVAGTYTFDMGVTRIAGDDVSFDPATSSSLAEYQDGVVASLGSGGDQIATGDRVLYAYGTGGEQLLALATVPARIAPGAASTLRVTDAASGVPSASVGGQTTAADATAQVALAQRGPATLEATMTGAMRSDAVTVCATDGADGACGTSVAAPASAAPPPPRPDRRAPVATIRGIVEGQLFARAHAPRVLRIRVEPDPSGLLAVKLRLTRNDRGRCTCFSGRSGCFRPNDHGGRCGAQNGYWFKVGSSSSVDYLSPSRLARGRHVLDVNAIDRAHPRDDARRRAGNRTVCDVA
jgi:hypothetical protein